MTLFFISAISLIILKNLDDSEKFIKEVSLDTLLTQLKITNTNVQEEIMNFINKYKDDEEVLEGIVEVTSAGIPLDYGNIGLIVTLDYFNIPVCYLNNIKTIEQLNETCVNTAENISYQYEFINILKQYIPLNNQNQIDYFLQKYINETRDDKISLVKNDFGFIKDLNKTSETKYMRCNYSVTVDEQINSSEFIFEIGSKKPIYFEYNF